MLRAVGATRWKRELRQLDDAPGDANAHLGVVRGITHEPSAQPRQSTRPSPSGATGGSIPCRPRTGGTRRSGNGWPTRAHVAAASRVGGWPPA